MIAQFVEKWLDGEHKVDTDLRMHGNGFLQLELGDGARLHIWSDDLPPAQRVNTAIHNHRFSFNSNVLLGTLINKEYRFLSGGTGSYNIYVPEKKDGENTELVATGQSGDFKWRGDNVLQAGEGYRFRAGDFHETLWEGLTATYFRKTMTHYAFTPSVACPADLEPDNEFDRYEGKGVDLWEFVDQVMEKIAPLYGHC